MVIDIYCCVWIPSVDIDDHVITDKFKVFISDINIYLYFSSFCWYVKKKKFPYAITGGHCSHQGFNVKGVEMKVVSGCCKRVIVSYLSSAPMYELENNKRGEESRMKEKRKSE